MNQHFLVHIILVHIILVHENLNKNLKLSLKNGREPELCEPELCEPWFTFSPGSHFSMVHVNHGSHNGQAPNFSKSFFFIFILRWSFLTSVTRKNFPRTNKSKKKFFGQELWIEKICKKNHLWSYNTNIISSSSYLCCAEFISS